MTEELLRGVIVDVNSHEELMAKLEDLAKNSRTSKLWLDCLIKPVFIMMMFIRAEREADWALHLTSVEAMMPYFFAARHTNYARYGLYYMRSMERLPNDVLDEFLQGHHVMRHNAGLWNGIWSDMFIESTFMRYGHGPGGIIGITLKPSTLERWALSLHICSKLSQDVYNMRDENETKDVRYHKEEGCGRIKADSADRNKIRDKLDICIDPLDHSQHPTQIVNIVTGVLCSENVDVDQAVTLGNTKRIEFEDKWPDGFHSTISKCVTTMHETKKRRLKINSQPVVDSGLIYSRVMGLLSHREMQLSNLLYHELAPFPLSMFDDSGEMRICKSKSVLKNKLQAEISKRTAGKPNTFIVDACAILWIIHWPTQGYVDNFIKGFINYVQGKLKEAEVYVVFDRYYKYSIKTATRTSRAGNMASRKHKLTLTTPLPPQNVALNVSENKVQLVDLICTE